MDKLAFTELHSFGGEREKILLYAGNSCIDSPLAFSVLGKIYLNNIPGQPAGNFSFSRKVSTVAKNTNKIRKISL